MAPFSELNMNSYYPVTLLLEGGKMGAAIMDTLTTLADTLLKTWPHAYLKDILPFVLVDKNLNLLTAISKLYLLGKSNILNPHL